MKNYIVPANGAVCISYQAGYYSGSSLQKFLTACISARLPETKPEQPVEINLFVSPELVATLHLANILVINERHKPRTFSFNSASSAAEAKRKAKCQYTWWRGGNLTVLCDAAKSALIEKKLIAQNSNNQYAEIIDTDGDELFRYRNPHFKNKDIYLRIKLHNIFTFFHNKKDELTNALAITLAFAQRGHQILNQAINDKKDLNEILMGTNLSPELLTNCFEYFSWEDFKVIDDSAVNILCELLEFNPDVVKIKMKAQEENDALALNIFCDFFLLTYENFKNSLLPHLKEIERQGITKEQLGKNFWSRIMFSYIDVLCYCYFDEDILYITPQEKNPCITHMVNIGKTLLNKTLNFPVKTSDSNSVREALAIAAPLSDEEKKQIIASLLTQLSPEERNSVLLNTLSPDSNSSAGSSSPGSPLYLSRSNTPSSASPTDKNTPEKPKQR